MQGVDSDGESLRRRRWQEVGEVGEMIGDPPGRWGCCDGGGGFEIEAISVSSGCSTFSSMAVRVGASSSVGGFGFPVRGRGRCCCRRRRRKRRMVVRVVVVVVPVRVASRRTSSRVPSRSVIVRCRRAQGSVGDLVLGGFGGRDVVFVVVVVGGRGGGSCWSVIRRGSGRREGCC